MDINGFCKACSNMADNFVVAGINTADNIYNELNKPPAVLAREFVSNISPVLQMLCEKTKNACEAIWQEIQQIEIDPELNVGTSLLVTFAVGIGLVFVSFQTSNPLLATTTKVVGTSLLILMALPIVVSGVVVLLEE